MTTIQLDTETRDELARLKRERGMPTMDAVVQDLLRPRPRREVVLERLRVLQPALHAMGVGAMHLTGSVARGEANAESDVDLIVELDDWDYMQLARIQRLAEAAVGHPCDLVAAEAIHPKLQDALWHDAVAV